MKANPGKRKVGPPDKTNEDKKGWDHRANVRGQQGHQKMFEWFVCDEEEV